MGCIILGCIIGDALFLDAFVGTDFRGCTVWDTFHFRGCIWDAFFGILSCPLGIHNKYHNPTPKPEANTQS